MKFINVTNFMLELEKYICEENRNSITDDINLEMNIISNDKVNKIAEIEYKFQSSEKESFSDIVSCFYLKYREDEFNEVNIFNGKYGPNVPFDYFCMVFYDIIVGNYSIIDLMDYLSKWVDKYPCDKSNSTIEVPITEAFQDYKDTRYNNTYSLQNIIRKFGYGNYKS